MKYTLEKVPGKEEWKCPYCDKVWPTPVHNPATRTPRPLDPKCVEVANAEVSLCPNVVISGTNILRRIKWNRGLGDEQDYPCRRRWMDAYLECKNEIPEPPIKPDCVQPCCTQKTGTLIVTVLDDMSNPLEKAGIYFWDSGNQGKTDKKGQARFSGLTEKKRYTLRVWKEATTIDNFIYVWPEKTVQSPEVLACKEVNHTVKLDGKYMPGKLQVLVLDNMSKILEKATVTIIPETWKPSNIELKKSNTKTDSLGLVYYYNLRIGEYFVQAFYEEGKSERKSVKIKDANWYKEELKIDFEHPEKKQFFIMIERASWMTVSKGPKSAKGAKGSLGMGVLLVSAVFKIEDSRNSARYEIKNAALADFTVSVPVVGVIGGGYSTMDGESVTFEAMKYYNGKELSVNDFTGRINLNYQCAGVGPISFWDARFDLEFIGHSNPTIKDRLMRKKGKPFWLKVKNVKPGGVKSSPGVDIGSGSNIPFVPKKTI